MSELILQSNKLLIYSMPIFFLAILVELTVNLRKKDQSYCFNTLLSNLMIGVLGTIIGFFTTGFGAFMYTLFDELKVLHFDVTHWSSFVYAIFVYDFCYYWFHRAHHNVNILWLSHSVHHACVRYNLSTAFRQSCFIFLTSWIFFVPMVILGFSLENFLFGAAVSVVYGFFTHTTYIPFLGKFEKIFIGASAHRVHHGSNNPYLDRNFGSILSIWDQLFGTFQEELNERPIVYGILNPTGTLNPLAINTKPYQILWSRIKFFSFGDKIRTLLKPPGWKPEDASISLIQTQKKQPKDDTATLSGTYLFYGIFQFVLALAFTGGLFVYKETIGLSEKLLWTSLICLLLNTSGKALDGVPTLFKIEGRRMVLIFIAIVVYLKFFPSEKSELILQLFFGISLTGFAIFQHLSTRSIAELKESLVVIFKKE
jgi:alkylglycerol monooxygenase